MSWPRILNPTNVSFSFNPRKLVPTKIKLSTVIANYRIKTDVSERLMPPFPNIRRIGLTFDLDLSTTDLNIDKSHVLIKDYLSTEIEVCGAKRS